MNDLESIILSLFDEGYTKSQIASQLDETLAKASSESEKARHNALITEDAANVCAAITKYYADKYNDSTHHHSIKDITELLDALYSDTYIIGTDLNTLDATLKRLQAACYDYFHLTHDSTEIEITPEEITYMLESYYNRDPDEALAQAVDTFLTKSVKDYKSGTLSNIFPKAKDVGDYVLTLYESYKYLKALGLNNKANFSDILDAIFNA